MAQKRVYYACEAVGFADYQNTPTTYQAARGVQSVGVNTTFNLEQVFEVGQLDIYDNVENLPDVEVTMEKVLDGYPLLFHLATQGATAGTLVGRSNQRCNVALSIFADTNTTASGNQLSQCILSGMYVSQVGYDIMVEGAAKETITLVGNNKVWITGGYTFTGFTAAMGITSYDPAAPEGTNRRQHLIMPSCVWPLAIRGISSSGTNNPVDDTQFQVAIQSVRASTNLGREMMLELGRRGPYFRYVQFPVQVTTNIEIMAKDGDMVNATEAGVLSYGHNVGNERIYLQMQEGLRLDLGTKNKLNTVTYGGANAGRSGGNATISYQFQGWSIFTVQHPADPTVPLRP